MFGERAVGAGERQDGLVRTADRTFRHGAHVDIDVVEEEGDLVQARTTNQASGSEVL